MIESMRLAFADRAVWMGDEDFVPVPKRGLLNPAYVALARWTDQLNARMATPAAGNPLAVRNRVARPAGTPRSPALTSPKRACTRRTSRSSTSAATSSATRRRSRTPGAPASRYRGWGFLLNNELTDFNFVATADPSTGNPGANDVAPFKRPRSSMTPTILFKGDEPFAAYGSPGGATIINSVLNVTLNLIDHGMTIQQAIDVRGLSVTSAVDAASCERAPDFMQPPIPQSTFNALAALGHLTAGQQARLRGTDRVGAGSRHRPAHRQAVRRCGSAARRHGDRARPRKAGSSRCVRRGSVTTRPAAPSRTSPRAAPRCCGCWPRRRA